MKKKIAVLAAGISAAALILAGCSSEISNDYITIGQYKGVEVEKVEPEEVTDESVENKILGVQQEQAVVSDVTDRPAEEGDTATIDYVGKKDGVAFQGGTANDYPLTLGSNSFIDGFEDGIVGHSIGETFDLNLTFPEDYGNAELAGQEVVFTVTLKSLTKTELPELNDEFVKSVSEESKTVEEYKKEVRKEMEEANKEAAEWEMKNALWNTIMENTSVSKYPKDRLKEISAGLREQCEQMAVQYDMEFEEFLGNMNMDEESFDAQVSKMSKNTLKQELMIDLLIEQGKIKVSDEMVEKECEKVAKNYGYESADELRTVLKDSGSDGDLEMMAKQTIVQNWLFENCKQVEKQTDDSADTDK